MLPSISLLYGSLSIFKIFQLLLCSGDLAFSGRGSQQIAVVVVVYFILSRLLYLAFTANLGLLCMPHPGMGPLV